MVPGVLSEHRENCGQNRGVTKAMHTKKEAKDNFETSDFFSGRKKEQS